MAQVIIDYEEYQEFLKYKQEKELDRKRKEVEDIIKEHLESGRAKTRRVLNGKNLDEYKYAIRKTKTTEFISVNIVEKEVDYQLSPEISILIRS